MTAVMMFAKAPRAGAVKTRLAREIGAAMAVRIYRAVGASVAAAISERYPLSVWYDPPDALQEMREWLGEHEFLPQPAGNLGVRLERAFRAHFARGDRPVIVVGADAPGVDARTIAKAEGALERSPVVVGPARDGGYYLLGLHEPEPQLFTGIPWSTSGVLQVTLETCARLHLAVTELEMLRDVDTAADAAALALGRP